MKKNRSCLRNNLYFLHKVYQTAPLYLWISAGLHIIMGIRTSFMSIGFLPYVISCVESGRSLAHVLIFIAASLVAVSITYVMQSVYDNIYQPVCLEKISQSLEHAIFQKALLTDLEAYDTAEYYTSVILANHESGDRAIAVVENILSLLEKMITIFSIIGYSLSIDWIAPVIAVLAFGIGYFLNRHIAGLRVDYDKERKIIEKKISMFHRILYLPDYGKDIRTTGIGDRVLRLYRKSNEEKDQIIQKKGGKIGRVSALETILSAAICIDFLVPLYLLFRILIDKTMMISQFVAIVNGCSQLQLKLEGITREIGVFYQNGELIERYRQVEKRQNKIEPQSLEEHAGSLPDFEKLELKNISFRYPGREDILKNVDLTIRRREKIAIVGRNGSGKTTLVKLLLRLYDCTDGAIFYNETPVRQITVHDYRSAFSALFQDFCVYAATVEKNIAMDQPLDEKRARDATVHVGLESILPYMKTPLTRELESDGLSFSGGQLQRLALSRLFYEDHSILIMDEPTSAMDVVFEKQFYDMIFHRFADKTILFVSHRLASAVMCDRIIYMENGRIVESGSHGELMKLNGAYAKLFYAQTEILK